MTHHLARQVKQTPAHGRHLVTPPVCVKGEMPEQEKQIVRNDAETEEDGIGSSSHGNFGTSMPYRLTSAHSGREAPFIVRLGSVRNEATPVIQYRLQPHRHHRRHK